MVLNDWAVRNAESVSGLSRSIVDLTRLLWHPRQKLWNRPLVSRLRAAFASRPKLAEILVSFVIILDSIMLLTRVLVRRARLVGFRTMWRSRTGETKDVLFVDCGVHQYGFEIRLLHEWFTSRYRLRFLAFEAGSRQYAAAARSLAGIPGLDFRNVALVGPDHDGLTATLYHWPVTPDGEGDSLHASRAGGSQETVRAVRLSEVLQAEYGWHGGLTVLRMNIEGSEPQVIQDLIVSGQCQRIDGFHGMWDDLSFIDSTADADFQSLLRTHNIQPITFNGRDVHYALRRLAIRLDVTTSLLHGEARRSMPRQTTFTSASENPQVKRYGSHQ